MKPVHPRNKYKGSKIYKLIDLSLRIIKKSRILRYSSKYSKRTYTQHQHIAILVLKTYLRLDYRGVCDLLNEMNNIYTLLNLKQIPHFTTIQKFLKRFNPILFDKLIAKIICSFNSLNNITIALDASGFSSSYSSNYYVMRINKESKKRHFLKSTIVIDTDKQLILGVLLRKGPSNDNKDFQPILRKIYELFNEIKIKRVLADKGYDSEKNLSFVKNFLNAEPIIKIREGNSSPLRNRGRKKLRRVMYLRFKKDKIISSTYHQRSKVETVFSVIKRKFGDELYSKTLEMRKKEAMLRHLVYNLYRLYTEHSENYNYFLSSIFSLLRFSTKPIKENI